MKDNKEDALKGLLEKYPKAFEEFRQWFEGYKERVSWDNLFGNFYKNTEDRVYIHDLPLAIQLGIFMQYQVDTVKEGEMVKPITVANILPIMESHFKYRESNS